MSAFPEVIVLQPGYAEWSADGKSQRADGTITLIKGEANIIVDTGLPKDRHTITHKLHEHGISPSGIQYVVCTHGDADHIANINLFPDARLVVGFDMYDGDVATFFQKNFALAPHITATEMLGHDDRSIGVLVETERGRVAITGDLFEQKSDYQNVRDWLAFSKNPRTHVKTRARIWELADYIVPGHGDMFKVDKTVDILSIETAALADLLKKSTNVYGDTEL